MILVDTAIWIDHLHATDTRLVKMLDADQVGSHPMVIEELALGSIKDRHTVLRLLANLHAFPVLAHNELLAMVQRRQLWGQGLSPVDAHLLGSVAITPGGALWTRDKNLKAAANEMDLPILQERS